MNIPCSIVTSDMKTKQNNEGSREGVFGKSSRVAREGLPEKVAIE